MSGGDELSGDELSGTSCRGRVVRGRVVSAPVDVVPYLGRLNFITLFQFCSGSKETPRLFDGLDYIHGYYCSYLNQSSPNTFLSIHKKSVRDDLIYISAGGKPA